MLGSTTNNHSIGETRRLLRESDLSIVEINAKMAKLTLEEQADNELVNIMRLARDTIENLVCFVDSMPAR